MPGAVVIGEAFVDLIAHHDPTNGLVYVPRFGGSPLNVAVGMRRLGVQVRLATTTAPDTFGRQVLAFFEREGIDARSLSSAVPRTVVSIATPAQGRVTYEYLGDVAAMTQIRSLPPTDVASAAVLHASSTAFNAEPAVSTVLKAYRGCGGFRSMDPNPRPALIDDVVSYRSTIETILSDVDLLKVSQEDLAFMYPSQAPTSSALRLQRTHGVPVVVTQASEPTLVLTGGGVLQVDVPPLQVLDATGAGDSFMACLLAQVCEQGQPRTSRDWLGLVHRANQAASITCRGVGGAESMPTRAQLDGSQPVASSTSAARLDTGPGGLTGVGQ